MKKTQLNHHSVKHQHGKYYQLTENGWEIIPWNELTWQQKNDIVQNVGIFQKKDKYNRSIVEIPTYRIKVKQSGIIHNTTAWTKI